MKRKITLLFAALLAFVCVMSLGVFAEVYVTDEDGYYTVPLFYEANEEYSLFAIKGEYDITNYIEAYNAATDEDIIYFEQKAADENGSVVFGPFAPLGYYNATLVVGGTTFEEPQYAGRLSAEGIKNAASLEIAGMQLSHEVNGMAGEDVVIGVTASIRDSFGKPSVSNEKVNITLSEGTEGVTVDSDAMTVTVDKMSKDQVFEIRVSTGELSDFVIISINRKAPEVFAIKAYLDEEMSEEVTSIDILGVVTSYPDTKVYLKSFDQYGDEIEDEYTYSFAGEEQPTSTIKASGDGEYEFVVTSKSGYSVTFPVNVTSRPAYTGDALRLYNLIGESEAAIKTLLRTVVVSEESGRDVYSGTKWISATKLSDFRNSIAEAKKVMDAVNAGTASASTITSAYNTLNSALTSFKNAPKSGIRVDATSITLENQDTQLVFETGSAGTRLKATLSPRTNTDKITWTSSNPESVTVDSDGNVKPVANGTATITATTRTGLSASLTVKALTKIYRLEIVQGDLNITYGDKLPVYTTVTYPVGQHNDTLVWTSSNPEAAYLQVSEDTLSATVVPVGTGKTTITATVASSAGTNRPIKLQRTVRVTMPDWATAESPVADVESGDVLKGTRVSLTSGTADAKIYYTLDGTTPSMTNGRLYVEPITITQEITLKAIAVKTNMYDSPVVTYEYGVKAPTLTADKIKANPGETVAYTISIAGNPGIKSLGFTVNYDESLTIVDAVAGAGIADYVDENYIGDGDYSFSLNSENAISYNGVLVTLYFAFGEDAETSVYDITVTTTSTDGIMYDIENGQISVENYILGDADDNGVISIADIVIIKQYLATQEEELEEGEEPTVVDINLLAADVTGDDVVNADDVMLLSKYCAGWNVTLVD